jgi:hypothetical protein
MSAFLGLTDAVVAALATAPAIAPGRVRRGRSAPVPQDWPDAVDVRLQRSEGSAQLLSDSFTGWESVIGVDVYARATGTDGEAAIDPLLASVFARIATTPPPAGAASWTLEPAITWDIDERDQTLVVAGLALRVTHFTAAGGLTPLT